MLGAEVSRLAAVAGQFRKLGAWALLAVLEAGAQMSLKVAAVDAAGTPDAWAPIGVLIHEPMFLVSLACDGCAFFVWMRILHRHNLSVAVPVSASCYFTTILGSYYVLAEPVAALQAAGLLLMGLGIYLIAGDRAAD